MKSIRLFGRIITMVAALLLAGTAHGALTIQGYWRLGEDDPGAASGNTVNAVTKANVGGLDLPASNPPFATYTNSAAPNSTLSVNFNVHNAFVANSVVSTATDNFGYEIWIKPQSGANSDRNVFGSDTIALIVHANEFRAVYQSVAVLDPTVNTSVSSFYDQWTHLAIVRESGTSTFYLNGVPIGECVAVSPSQDRMIR